LFFHLLMQMALLRGNFTNKTSLAGAFDDVAGFKDILVRIV